jgi:hypothetical protein
MELSMSQLDQLESEAAAQRALFADAADGVRSRIAETADDLRERISPSRIVRRTGQNWRGWIEDRARDNPIQVASAAAMLAYPAWRIARALPMPILIAGAGVLLSSKAPLSMKQAGDLIADARGKTRELGNRLADATEVARETGAENLAIIGASARESVTLANDAIQNAANSTVGNIKGHLSRATETAATAVSSAVESITPSGAAIQSFADGARAAANTAGDIASDAARSSTAYTRGAANAVAHNPLLIAGLGLAAGGLLAALLPRTKADDRMLGGLAGDIQDSTEDALSEGHQRVTKAITTLQHRAADEAEARGITADAIQDAVEDLNERASDVATAAKRTSKRNAGIRENHHD